MQTTTPDAEHLAALITAGHTITTRPLFDGAATLAVLLDGRRVGTCLDGYAVHENGIPHGGNERAYRYPDGQAAVAGIVSAATRGYWTGER